jgi:hypothetical protein
MVKVLRLKSFLTPFLISTLHNREDMLETASTFNYTASSSTNLCLQPLLSSTLPHPNNYT